jgi:putative ABC transport system permease protein
MIRALGVEPALGRLFNRSEDRFGAEKSVVLTHGFWKRQFGGDPDLIGKPIPLSGNSYVVIGILPEGFEFPREKPDLLALVRVVNPVAANVRGVHFLRTVGLLKKGVNLDQARAEMKVLDKALEKIDPVENKGRQSELMLLQERIVGKTRPALLILLAAVSLVLLIACANFANLLLARAISRQQELVIRSALGAESKTLMIQMLTESILIALLGGLLGLAFAYWGIQLLLALEPENLPRLAEIHIDSRVLLFTLGISFLTGLIFGLIPAWASIRQNTSDALKESSRSTTPGMARHRIRSLLVVGELALAVLLLIGSGLLIKAFWSLHSVDPGFNPNGILTMRLVLPDSRYEEVAPQERFREALLNGLNEQRGIQAAMISEVPLAGDWLFHNFLIEGRAPITRGEEPEIQTRTVAGDYFRLMGIPVIQGRAFTNQDRASAPIVAVINQTAAKKYFPDGNAIGSRVRWASLEEPIWMTIVGVVGDVKHFGLELPEEPSIYAPYAQIPFSWKRWMVLVVKGTESPAALTEMVKRRVWQLDSQLPITEVQSMNQIMSSSLARQRFNMIVLTVFSATALLLAAIGIYGVISYSVSQRSHEIGIRMALGAQSSHVMKLVVGEGFILACIALLIGISSAYALTRFMAGVLFGVSATDPLIFGLVAVILSTVALIACYVPARRASQVSPMIALRYE